ncbi:zinc carboxypeptidase A 1-like [Nymphalis io]|uniref:zinc carboxypeptidase A 1-like n=1 Tax=Inachis io TaxID=171585 RepID=UPI00216A75E3|nr:zinc carboxypeptidase A 1-like [Nymphalis io]
MYNDVQILVAPNDLDLFKERLRHFQMNGVILTSDIQKFFDHQKIRSYTRMQIDTFAWDAYHNLEGVYQWMTDITSKYYEKVTLKTVGKSAEGREILAIEIRNPRAKSKVIVEGAIHGNEWITTEFVTYLAYKLIHADKTLNSRLKQVAKRYHWFLIPVANPDGYNYSMTVDRLWRKNRRDLGNGTFGVDLNRNFDYNFCNHGGSNNPNNEYYCGPEPFSEPESRALSYFIDNNKANLNYYFAFHSYGQKIIIPYSDRVKHIENFSEMENYGKQAILKMYKLNGVKYGVGTIYDTYGYKTSGDSISWVKKTYQVKYSVAFILRDNGTYGYALPQEKIQPTCREMLIGLVELMTVFKSTMKLITVYVFLIFISLCWSKKYYNHSLYRGIPVTENHLDFFNNISKNYDVYFWRLPGLVYRPVEFLVPPEKKAQFIKEAAIKGIYLTTLIEDIQSAFDMQTVKTYIRRNMDSFDWSSYFRLDDIYNWMQDLNKLHPKSMQLINIGETKEKRDILVARVVLDKKPNKPKVIVEGGIHAREWISIAFVTYFLNQIVTAKESKDMALTKIAETYEWYFVPVLNPDGYEYTHLQDRMHRKNTNDVDINRNFGIAFGTVGVSKNKSSDVYCGPIAFSEAESVAMGNFVRENSKNLQYYLAFHSYGQYMIIPYAFSMKHHENFDVVRYMGQLAANSLSERYGTHYSVGTAYDTVGYITSGVSGCWVKKSFKVPYSIILANRRVPLLIHYTILCSTQNAYNDV